MAHMHYKGTGQMHSFRGLLASGAQQKIRIQGPLGSIAWRITKFQTVGYDPTTLRSESVTKIYRETQTAFNVQIDFNDAELLGVAVWKNYEDAHRPLTESVIFDNALFSRDIYVTQKDSDDNSINYYIELEEVKLSAAGMAQLAVAAARRI